MPMSLQIMLLPILTHTSAHTYAQKETSRSMEDVPFLALTVLSLIPSLGSYTVRGKQNLA